MSVEQRLDDLEERLMDLEWVTAEESDKEEAARELDSIFKEIENVASLVQRYYPRICELEDLI